MRPPALQEMKFGRCVLAICTITAALSCDNNVPPEAVSPEMSVTTAPAPSFANLTEKDDVLVNLELAYEAGNSTEFSRLLDVDFVFCFSEKDVALNDVLTSQWDRSLERIAFSYMFAEPVPTGILGASTAGDRGKSPQVVEERTWGYVKNYFFVSPWDSVTSLSLDLLYNAGDGQWVPFVDPGSGETWYRKAAQYGLTVQTAQGRQFQCVDGEASFVVREQPGLGTWQLVEWDDIKPWFKDLQDQDDVLVNLELAYNDLNLEQIDRLLDDNFIFFFSDSDFFNGYTPAQWDRTAELLATSNMFSGDAPPGGWPISSIDVSLIYPPGPWIPFTPPDFPTETWYQKSVRYNIAINAGPMSYMAFDIDMVVEIRYADVGGESYWRMVGWRDLFGVFRSGGGILHSAVVEEISWGHIKALYSGP